MLYSFLLVAGPWGRLREQDGTYHYMNNPTAANPAESGPSQLEKLLKGCAHSIDQCDYLLQQISDESYVASKDGASSIGSHMRHILDRFQCFFTGLGEGCVDYDARDRDQSIASNLEAARFAVASVSRRIQEVQGSGDDALMVRESVHHLSPEVVLESTVSRELMGLVTHTTHHLALIGLIAQDLGYSLEGNFGKAASTIVYESN